ncbi:uncharacterized protein SETTUDRAFT_167005 [Exserohilum turcica Et28A]|uniref:DUF7730 domain-containing protein n=1 Tax=Exserohilum turcicum (strain 28A) TaxID=671987 RepID=R0IZT6_EXST2|nr:uncharacterized protein SETTUDRAFT_167005 [Exserohilum turcica Et28A]EOA90046.1 hypothetical protein SETTUDRAFT_167005 [Exserohilum turcica Et28A]
MPELPPAPYGWLGPWSDPCMNIVHEQNGKLSKGYNIGIMGFLLSCKQAYAEGMHVLFSENCINIQSESLLLHLPQLITFNRLASITSLEVVITAHRVQKEDEKAYFNWDHLKPILDNISTHCHHLRSLCLSFMFADGSHGILDSPALSWIDTFHNSMQLRKMRIELPTQAYWTARHCWPESHCQSMESYPLEDAINGALSEWLWRSLDDEKPIVQIRSTERYPYPPLKLPVAENWNMNLESSGY